MKLFKLLKLLNLLNLFKRPILRGGYLTLTLALTFFLMSCATSARKMPDTSQLQWPFPPAEAKVKYVRWWSGEVDFKKSFMEQVLGESGIPGLSIPRSATTDRMGNIYVADMGGGGIIMVFDIVAGRFRRIETIGAITLVKPVDILVDDGGNLWVADTGRNRVIKYNKEGNFLMAIGKEGELKIPIRLAMDKERERLYVLNKNSNIRVYDLSGKFLFAVGSPTAGKEQGSLFNPQGIAIDREGNIYVADTFNFSVQSFSPDGKFRSRFGIAGDAFGSFARPVAVAVDSEGNIYVADTMFNNIQVFDKSGKYMFTIGEEGYDPGQFTLPTGIHIDENDRIYVADQLNGVIQVFQYLSEKYKKGQAEQPVKQ